MPLEKVEAGRRRRGLLAPGRAREPRDPGRGRGHRVATIYGALSPEVRRAEAARFRAGEADVLVTTDAIGMGLNLGPLKRIVFSAVRKWDGIGRAGADQFRDPPDRRPRGPLRPPGRRLRRGRRRDAAGADPRRRSRAPRRRPAADTRFFVRPDLIAIRSVAEEMRTRQPARGADALRPRDLLRRLAVPALGPGGGPGGRPRGRPGAAADRGEVRLLGLPDRPARRDRHGHAGALVPGAGGRHSRSRRCGRTSRASSTTRSGR